MTTQQLDKQLLLHPDFCSLSYILSAKRHASLLVSNNADWAQFKKDVITLRARLKSLPFKRYALSFDDSYLFSVAFIALAYAGKEVVLPSNHQPSALADLVEHFDAIIHDNSVTMPIDRPQVPLPLSHPDIQVTEIDLMPISLEELKVTLFTSGSSGTPKAILKTLKQIDTEICHLEALWGKKLKGASIVSTVSHQHIYGLLFRVLWPLCAGRPFCRQVLNYPEQVFHASDKNTVLISSPALLKRLDERPVLYPFRAIFSSGGPLNFSVAQGVRSVLAQLPLEVFGSTETGGVGYRQQQEQDMPWQKFEGIELSLNLEGCLKLKSPYLATQDWYQTADICEILGANHFRVMGRSDRVVKVEEKRISLAEVERHLCNLEWIDEAVVLPLQDPNRLVVGSVVTLSKAGQQKLIKLGRGQFGLTVRQTLRQWVEPVGIPRRFRIVDEIPQNSQGKHQVRELQQLFMD